MPDMSKADAFYLEARDAVLAAVTSLGKDTRQVRTPAGVTFRIQRKTPLRIYLLMIYRQDPGADGETSYNFRRNGRVEFGGARKVPLRDALAAGHDPWASRQELLDLAAELREAATAP